MSRFLLPEMTLDRSNDWQRRSPNRLYVLQMTFAIITRVICGAHRRPYEVFGPVLGVIGSGPRLRYAPDRHWGWGAEGSSMMRGVLDFAGGTVVHSIPGLRFDGRVVMGKRTGLGTEPSLRKPVLSVIGARLMGWLR